MRGHETDRLAALTTEINGLGGDVRELPDGLEIRPRPLHGGVFHTYDDHRMVMAGAVLGLAVPGVEVENLATVGKTLPDFGDLWAEMLRVGTRPWRATGRGSTRTTYAYGRARDHGRAPAAVRRTTTPSAASSWPSTAAATPASSRARAARPARRRAAPYRHRDARARAGPQGRGRRRPRRPRRRRHRRARHARPHRARRTTRTSTLRRTADDTDPVERVIVANADQLVIVTALADPEPRPRMIDRCLVAAYDAGLEPLLCLTKADLASPDALLETYAPLGVAARRRRARTSPSTSCASAWTGSMSVLVGHSGVGKSTLVNALVPDADRAVSEVNPVTGARPAHVLVGDRAAAARRRRLDHRHAGRARLRAGPRRAGGRPGGAFPDLAERAAEACPTHCTHRQDDCSLDAWVAEGHADPSRLDSLRRLLASREGDEA